MNKKTSHLHLLQCLILPGFFRGKSRSSDWKGQILFTFYTFNSWSICKPSLVLNWLLQEYNLVWCPVFKAASTNWMKNIIRLANLGERLKGQLEKKFKKYEINFFHFWQKNIYFRQPNYQAWEVAPKLNSWKLKQYGEDKDAKRMLIVRHPFDRFSPRTLYSISTPHFFQTGVRIPGQAGAMHH